TKSSSCSSSAATAPTTAPPSSSCSSLPHEPPHRAAAHLLTATITGMDTAKTLTRKEARGRKRAHSRPSTSSSGSRDQFASSPYDEPLEEVQERSSSCSTCIFVTIVVLFMVGSCSALLVFAYKVAIGDPPMIAVIIGETERNSNEKQ
ncbi:hypothetical protein OSTOST_05562, partial [Ostertagia ostertagi]